jgi:two-component sensor histidine kinase
MSNSHAEAAWLPPGRLAGVSDRLFRLSGAAVILALVLLVALMVRAEWQRLLVEVEATSTTLAAVLADNADRLLETADLVRQQVGETVGRNVRADLDIGHQRQLARLVAAAPPLISIWVGDAEGRATLTSREWPTPAMSAADRNYFLAVRDDPERFFIGTLTDNRWADGTFLGFIQVSLSPAHLRRTFGQVRLAYQTALWLISPDGVPLMREPYVPLETMRAVLPPVFDVTTIGEHGHFDSISLIDGEARRFYFTRSPQYGAYILVGVQQRELYAQWRARMLPTAVFGALLVVALALVLVVIDRARTSGLRHARALEAEVAARTAELVEVGRERELVLRELRHRVRNAFTVILALTRQTLHAATDLDAVKRDLPERLSALAGSQVLLVESEDRRSAALHEVVWTELEPHRDANGLRITVEGPPIRLPEQRVTALAMVLHELATNALKYGALSVPEGRLTVRWAPIDAGRRLRLEWQETDGPEVVEATRRGFGSVVLEQSVQLLKGELELDHHPAGVRAVLTVQL